MTEEQTEIIKEDDERTLLVKIAPEALKKLRILGLHYNLKQQDIVEKIINDSWERVKVELIEIE